MSAKHAVLGLVVERPGYGYELTQRLQERFGCSAFAPSGVYSALDQLKRDALVRTAGEVGRGPARRAAPRMIYEATEKGVERFESWMRGASRLPPQRDELHMKIALARPRDVPGLIDAVYEQELACTQRLRELGPHGALELSGGAHDWSRRMRGVRAAAEIASWQARVEWLRSARALLESLLEDGASRAHAPARERAAHLG